MAKELDFKRYFKTIRKEEGKKVKSMDFKLVASNVAGDINFTDLQLQSGSQATAPIPNSEEMLNKVPFTIDENDFLNSVNNPVKIGVQPQIYENIENRIFNIVGRGSESVAFPNIQHEDYSMELVTSALDLVIYPKDDYDLVRISTSEGSYIKDRQYDNFDIPPLSQHPLNKRYTREFYYVGGSAGDEIKLTASKFMPTLNGQYIPLMQGKLNVNGTELNDVKQRFMLAPYGSFRIRIEFFKEVTETLYWSTEHSTREKKVTYFKDVGIGFYGYGEFNQYRNGERY